MGEEMILALYYNCAIGLGLGNMSSIDLGRLNRSDAVKKLS
jgi:hypothetical protein